MLLSRGCAVEFSRKRSSHYEGPRLWQGSFNGKESSLQQLAPYIGKLKTGLVQTLIAYFTKPDQWVCDPFSGSGVVPLEALRMGRKAAANDLSVYAYCLTRGKLEVPDTYTEAVERTENMLTYVTAHSHDYDLRRVDRWVRNFFHPRTLRETMAAFEYCSKKHEWFLLACICGILHHQRPGFLSYPASHTVPYLRDKLFPRRQFPELYEYRPLGERIRAKVRRAYRRPLFNGKWHDDDFEVHGANAQHLPFSEETMDLILTSPPYYGALDYARDNRLRLWFLGVNNWHDLDQRLTASFKTYEEQMAVSLSGNAPYSTTEEVLRPCCRRISGTWAL